MAKRFITCKRCGTGELAWEQGPNSGRWQLVTATKVDGVVVPGVVQHVCGTPPHSNAEPVTPWSMPAGEPFPLLGPPMASVPVVLTEAHTNIAGTPDPVAEYVARGRALSPTGPYSIGFRHEDREGADHHVPDIWIDVDTQEQASQAIIAFANRPGNANYSLMGVWDGDRKQVVSFGGMEW